MVQWALFSLGDVEVGGGKERVMEGWARWALCGWWGGAGVVGEWCGWWWVHSVAGGMCS